MFQPSETDAVMLTAMTYFEFQQLTSLWRFLKNKSHSLNSAKLEHCDTWRKFKVLALQLYHIVQLLHSVQGGCPHMVISTLHSR